MDGLHGPGRNELLREEVADRTGTAGRVVNAAFASPYRIPRCEIRPARDRLSGTQRQAASVARRISGRTGSAVIMERRSNGYRKQITA